jgi:peptidyl-prolyl cis-trans isomerase B (cyclophilin B)
VRALLADADPGVKLAASKAVGQLEDGEALQPLFLLTKDPDWRVRANVATSLGQLKVIEALAGLAVLAKDASVNVRTAVAAGLKDIPYHYKKDDLLFPLRKATEPQVRAATLQPLAVGLEEMAAMVDEHWIAAGDSSTYVVTSAYESFADASRRVEEGLGMNKWRSASTFYMKGRLKNPEAPLAEKIAAAYHLGAFDTEWPRPELVSVLSQEHWAITAAAIHGLGEMTPTDTASARRHRELTPDAIGDVLTGDPQAAEEVDIRLAAAEALGSFDTPRARELLHGLLRDPEFRVREQAAESLEKLGEAKPEIEPAGELAGSAEPLDPEYLKAKQGRFVASIRTNRGEIQVELYNRDAPRTVQSFVELARKGFYDSLIFHRVVPNFVVQGGCPIGNGWGHPGYTLRCEYNRHRYDGPGVVGMAHAGKDTGGSQFFITHSAQPHLDGRYTVFGRVVAGMDVVDAIQVEDRIESVSITKKMW